MKYLSSSMLCATAILSGVATFATPSIGQTSDPGIPIANSVKYVPSGVKRNLWLIGSINPDCSSTTGTVVRVEQQPSNGKVEVVPGDGFFHFAADNPRSSCNGKKTPGLNLSYQSNPKFTGEDEFSVMVLYPSGNARLVNYKINVK